jgi:hypothetical protein
MMREDDGVIGELIFIAKNLDVMICMKHRASKLFGYIARHGVWR